MMALISRISQTLGLAALFVGVTHALPPLRGIGKAHKCEWPYDSCCVSLADNPETESGAMWVKQDTKPGTYNEVASPK